jgi:hypothetical protein
MHNVHRDREKIDGTLDELDVSTTGSVEDRTASLIRKDQTLQSKARSTRC